MVWCKLVELFLGVGLISDRMIFGILFVLLMIMLWIVSKVVRNEGYRFIFDKMRFFFENLRDILFFWFGVCIFFKFFKEGVD